ncbi:MAG: hypothetical protein MSS47_07760 [Bacteroidales bacterium]|nr:hypothetical protein [Bacteroidales bacterium]MCI7646188.1 hypothetical protein [Bacteroidales bacterium]
MRTSILCKSLLTMALTIAFTSAQAQTTTTCTQCNDSIRDAKACTARPGEQCDTCTHKAGAHVRRAQRLTPKQQRPGSTQHIMAQGRHIMAQGQRIMAQGRHMMDQAQGRHMMAQGQHMMAQGRHMMAQGRHMMDQAQCGKAKCKACKAKKHTCKATNRYTPFSRMQRLEMAKAYIKGHGAINAKAYAKMTGLKRAMAEGELATFCNMSNAGIKAKAEGKKTVYVLK